MKIGRYFVFGLFAFGIVAGLIVAASPRLRALPVPPFVWPLILALLVDLAVLPLVRAGRVEAITMNERAIGVIGSALILTVILAATPAR
jgi:hypothetical protein